MNTTISQTDQNEIISSHYDKSEKWNKELYVDEGHYFNRLLIRRKEYAFQLLDGILNSREGAAIDIGCGPGAYVQEFINRGFDSYGVDISQEMLNTCKERLKIDDSTFESHFKCCSIEQLPFESNTFSVASCIGVLGLLFSDDIALSEICRVLKPGGIFILAVENMMSFSNIDFIVRNKIKNLLTQNILMKNRASHKPSSKREGITLSSNYFPSQLGLFYKLYNPWKLEVLMQEKRFRLINSLTVGHEFRILRRYNLFPEIINTTEVRLEKLLSRYRIPYFSYSGQFYIGAFQKR